jgi:hypothetical protein
MSSSQGMQRRYITHRPEAAERDNNGGTAFDATCVEFASQTRASTRMARFEHLAQSCGRRRAGNIVGFTVKIRH